jgi:uncharacterized protein (DUF2147 family)
MSFNTAPRHKDADNITGLWMNTDNNLEVEIFKYGCEYKARVVWFDGSDDKNIQLALRCDVKNPDEQLRARKVIGMEVMHGLVYSPDNDDWEDGSIYDASSGRTWNANALLTPNGELKVRGYWHFQLIGRNIFFKRV